MGDVTSLAMFALLAVISTACKSGALAPDTRAAVEQMVVNGNGGGGGDQMAAETYVNNYPNERTPRIDHSPVESFRADRREATRQAGMPTSQQPTNHSSPRGPGNKPTAGNWNTTLPRARNWCSISCRTGIIVHWEAGKPKPGGQTDAAGRPRLQNDKVNVEEK